MNEPPAALRVYYRIINAIKEGNSFSLEKLLPQYPGILRTMGQKMFVPLVHAGRNGNTDIVKLLLKHDADPNEATLAEQHTPLMAAAKQGSLENVNLLLERNAALQKIDYSGMDAIAYAVLYDHRSIVHLFLNYDITVLHCTNSSTKCLLKVAAQGGSCELINLLLTYNPLLINMYAADELGLNPLGVAVVRYHYKDDPESLACVELLVQHGVSAIEGELSALSYAQYHNLSKIVSVLGWK